MEFFLPEKQCSNVNFFFDFFFKHVFVKSVIICIYKTVVYTCLCARGVHRHRHILLCILLYTCVYRHRFIVRRIVNKANGFKYKSNSNEKKNVCPYIYMGNCKKILNTPSEGEKICFQNEYELNSSAVGICFLVHWVMGCASTPRRVLL